MTHAFFDYVTQTRIISLKRRTDRRRDMAKELQRIGQSIDGFAVLWFDAIAPETAGDFPSIGARGCFLSHLEVLRAAQQANAEMLLILEDDAHFSKAFARHHSEILSALQTSDWDIFYAGYTLMAPASDAGPLAEIAPDIPLQCAHAVVFRKSTISLLIKYLEAILTRPPGSADGGPMHVDGAYNWFRKAHPELRTVVAVPQIVTQRASASDITPTGRIRHILGQNLGLRRIRNFFS